MRISIQFPVWVLLGIAAAQADSNTFNEVKSLPLRQEFITNKDWHVSTYQPQGDEAEIGDVPSKLCFWFEPEKQLEHCINNISRLPKISMVYPHQTVKELSVISTPHLVKFIAEYSGGASGLLDQISFWKYDKITDSFSNAGQVILTEQGEYRLLEDGTLITADAKWDEGETHFAPHYFIIQGYGYQPNKGYVKRLSYLTTSKYPSLNDADNIDVISHELPEIKKRL